MAGVTDAASASDPRDVALDRAVDEIEHAIGHLSPHQAIDVRRIVERFADDNRSAGRCPECPWA